MEKLHDAEYKFMTVIWDNEPVNSTELVRLCQQALGWKKSTTYTVLRKLSERGFLRNDNAVVTTLVKREEALRAEGEAVLEKAGYLPLFLTAFLGKQRLSEEEAAELKRIIDESRNGGVN